MQLRKESALVKFWTVTAVLFTFLCSVAFGIIVLDEERGKQHFGVLGQAALSLAETPWTLKQIFNDRRPVQALRGLEFDGQAGWLVHDADAGKDLSGYLLHSYYDGGLPRHVVELVALPELKVLHRWMPDADVILEGVPRTSPLATYTSWQNGRYRAIHPALFPNGDLLIKDHQSVLARIDACSGLVWRQAEMLFHHSTEPDEDGTFWVPGYTEPAAVSGAAEGIYDDTLVKVSADGEILYRKSLMEAFAENDLFHVLFTAGTFHPDPLHLNDIQPVPGDGPFWKEGDLFLSFRHTSTVLLYRPSTNRIIWSKAGPWMAQHDVDILDDHRIMIFNNNAYDAGRGGRVQGHAQLMIYDFDSASVSLLHDATMARESVVTQSEGLADLAPSGHVMLEQENDGRLLILGPDGRVFASFVNRAPDGRVYRLGWSRLVSKMPGDAAAEALANSACRL